MAETIMNPAYAAAVAEIDREIEELQRAKAILIARGGAGAEPNSPAGITRVGAFAGDPVAAVREQEFSGMSPAKATRAFLLKIGRHEKTPVIIAAIKKGGVAVGGKHPIASMYTALKRHSGFVSLGKNYWDLAERRPDMVRQKGAKAPQKLKKPKHKPRPKTERQSAPSAPKALTEGPR